tara:strand:- start:668 stop:2446 length:1779 start_codon:yes stop_codon:yes gene_type:complete
MVNPIDKVIARKTAVDEARKEIKRRRNISKRTKGKTRKRKPKSKYKKRRKKKITTTQVAQPPIRLTNKGGDKLEVNITAKERRKKRKAPKSFAQRRAEEIEKTGIADPSILKQQERFGVSRETLDASVLKAQQQVASEVLGYTTQSRDPLTLRGRRGRYNQEGGVGGFFNVSGRFYSPDEEGLRTGLQSEAIKSIGTQTQDELDRQASQRRRRQPTFRGGGGGGGGDDDDDDRRPPRPPSRYTPSPSLQDIKPPTPSQTKRTPQPQPEPEPESDIQMRIRDRPASALTDKTDFEPLSARTSPAPIPRRTPPESYFAGALGPDTPLRFIPLNQPVPPATPLPDVEEEIVEITGGQEGEPAQTAFVPAGLPEYSQFPDAPTTPEGFDPDVEGFATPFITDSQAILPPEEPLPKPETRGIDVPTTQTRRPELSLTRQVPTPDIPDISPSQAFRPVSRAKKPPTPEPEPEPEQVIQSVRRGRGGRRAGAGRPRGAGNLRSASAPPELVQPFILDETGEEIAQAELKFQASQIQRILQRRLGVWNAKQVDKFRSLGELERDIDELISSAEGLDNPQETADLIRNYWRIRNQLGFTKI